MAQIEVDKPLEINFTIQRGNDVNLPMYIKDNSGVAIDITGWNFSSVSKSNWDQPTLETTWTISVISAANGHLELSLTSQQTVSPTAIPDESVYNIFYIDNLGKQKKACYGSITVFHSAL